MANSDDKDKKIYEISNDTSNYDVTKKSESELQRKRDAFLDSYSVYLENKSFLPKSILKRRIIELELIDPSFDFDLND